MACDGVTASLGQIALECLIEVETRYPLNVESPSRLVLGVIRRELASGRGRWRHGLPVAPFGPRRFPICPAHPSIPSNVLDQPRMSGEVVTNVP